MIIKCISMGQDGHDLVAGNGGPGSPKGAIPDREYYLLD
jgi:hypothetical protein